MFMKYINWNDFEKVEVQVIFLLCNLMIKMITSMKMRSIENLTKMHGKIFLTYFLII